MNRDIKRSRSDARITNPALRFFGLIVWLAAALIAVPAQANFSLQQQQQAFPRMHFQTGPLVSQKEPVLIEADQMDYDRPNNTVIAVGHVQISQGNTIVLADQMTYDQTNDLVKARGHVSVLEPTGNVYFSDELELTDDLKAGVIHEFKSRLQDNSLFVASNARKKDENVTELYNAAYTPCKVCADKHDDEPLWQIKADHILIDEESQEVFYDNAFMEVYGTPILYTPYFSHATPGADNQTGFLIPDYSHSTNLGSVFKVPVYYTISPDKDITLTPIYTSKEGLVMAGEYREMFDSGPLDINGSITDGNKFNASGDPVAGSEVRGHIFANGTFKFTDDTDWGFNLQRTSDETYLRLYDFSGETLLTSRVYGEAFNFIGDSSRTYASVQGLSFQGLAPTDNAKNMPLVLPLADFNYESNPGAWNSRFTFDANALSLYRQEGDESRRISTTGGWKLPYLTDDGQIIEVDTTLRTDVYSVNNVTLANGDTFNGVTGRVIPQLSTTWRYPFINRWSDMSEFSSVMIEPIVKFDASPNTGNTMRIPNEDSLLPEFTDSNLFSDDRYAGLDRVETGPRVSYGIRGQAQMADTHYIDWLFGQHYQANNDGFPYSSDPGSHLSDYVGKVGLSYDPVTLAYRFRLDRDNFAPNRSEVDSSYSMWPFVTSLSYLSLKDDPILGDRQEIVGTETLALTREWSWSASLRRDLLLNKNTSAATGFTYKNECIDISTMIDREDTRILDVLPSTSILFRISFKNLE